MCHRTARPSRGPLQVIQRRTPIVRSLEVVCQQRGIFVCALCVQAFVCPGHRVMKLLSFLQEQRFVRRLLQQGMLEPIGQLFIGRASHQLCIFQLGELGLKLIHKNVDQPVVVAGATV